MGRAIDPLTNTKKPDEIYSKEGKGSEMATLKKWAWVLGGFNADQVLDLIL